MSSNTISKNPPYADTSTSWEYTRIDIESLLKKYGAKDVAWVSLEGGVDILHFSIEVLEPQGDQPPMRRKVTVSVSPPKILVNRRPHNRGPLIPMENKNQEYRLLFHWVKSKLEAVAWGLSNLEREFLSEINVTLPGGEQSTVGEVVHNLVAKNNLQSLPFLGQAGQRPPPRRVIEADEVIKP